MRKGFWSAIAITVFLIALNTISVKRFVDKFNENAFQKENVEFKLESTKRDSINSAATKDFNHQLDAWEAKALSTNEAKALIALAERNIRIVKLDTNKVGKQLRIEKAQAELDKVKLKAFKNYETKAKRPVKKEVRYAELVSPDRGSDGWIWFLSALIGLLLAGVEYAVIQKSVTGLPFMAIGLIYGSVLLYVHQAAMVFYFELPATVGIGFSLLLTISAFLNYVQIADQKLAGGVLYYSNLVKDFWKELAENQKLEADKKKKFREKALLNVDNEVSEQVKAYKAEKQHEFEELMARLEIEKSITINQLIREGFIKDAQNMESSVDKLFDIEKSCERLGHEYKPDIHKAFTQRLLTMKNAMTEVPTRIAEKPHTNGKPIEHKTAPVRLHRFEAPKQSPTFSIENIKDDNNDEILMPPHDDDEDIQKNVIQDANINSDNEQPYDPKRMSDAEILVDARERKSGGEKMGVRDIERIYGIKSRGKAYKIFQILGK